MPRRRRLEPTSAAERTTLGEQRKRFEQARDRLRQIPDELASRLDAIEANDDLPAEGKRARSEQARAEAAREVEELVAQAHAALEEGAARTKAMRRARTGRQAERDRVRALLARGDAAGEIFQRATELGDVESIAALRNELLWVEEPNEEVEGLLGECDRAIATLDSGEQAALNTAAVNLRESAAGFSELAELAVKSASSKPTARARLRLGYAEDADVN
jgi:hypothetical protein